MAKTAEYGIGDFTYPRGWLMVAASVSVTTIPSDARFFGEDVVLYRGASGRPVMLEAYCPHMGAPLEVGASGVRKSVVSGGRGSVAAVLGGGRSIKKTKN